MEIVLINNELFYENGPVKEDTIISKFVPYISLVQKLYIEPILGKPPSGFIQFSYNVSFCKGFLIKIESNSNNDTEQTVTLVAHPDTPVVIAEINEKHLN